MDEKASSTKPDKKGASDQAKDKDKEREKSDRLSEDQEATRTQLKIFINDIKQRATIPDIVSYLKLCTSISVSKLAVFLKTDEQTVAEGLINLQHKARSLQRRGAGKAPASAELDIDVAINKDVVLVSEYKAARRYGEFFIRQILAHTKLVEEILGWPQAACLPASLLITYPW